MKQQNVCLSRLAQGCTFSPDLSGTQLFTSPWGHLSSIETSSRAVPRDFARARGEEIPTQYIHFGEVAFGRPLSSLWSAVRSKYWGHNCADHHMYNGDLLIPDSSAVRLQLQQPNLSEETSIHLVHQGRTPTAHLAVR